jgi:hypothetical protein
MMRDESAPGRPSKVVEIIFWHTARMPDEHRSIQPRRDKPLYVMIGSAGLVIAWFEIFWRHCL